MKSPYTRAAAVAAIGLAVLSVLFPMRHGIVPESVALADVQKAVQAQETVFTTGTRTITFQEKPAFVPPGVDALFERPKGDTGPFVLEFNAESYLSPQGYATKIYAQDGTLVLQASVHNETGKATLLLPTAKVYVQFDVVEPYRQRMAAFTIQGFIDMIYKSGDSREVGPKRVQGVEAVGFEAGPWDEQALQGINPYFVRLLFNIQQGTGRVWIDPETKLPIQTEGEIKLKACILSLFKDADAKQIDNNFQWGVEIDESVFAPEIPEDYRELTLPSTAALGIAASSVTLAAIAPWCIFFIRWSRRRAQASRVC
ncbi:MAG: hypothetical protein JW955_04005 [Sedimentisphaerales bacterium]|nr:hypothetical protein [Sedimentisphaerales bacterium]